MRKLILMAVVFVLSAYLVFYFSSSVMAVSTSGTVVVQSIPGPTLAQTVVDRAASSWPWYVVRGSGFVAAGALIILMLSGIGMITGRTFKFLEPITAWASHRALGIVFGISVLVHMLGLLFDNFVPFDILTLFIPWLSNYKPVNLFGLELGSLYVALGVLAFYGAFLIVVTSLLWLDKKPYIWKLIHLLSYMVMAFVFIHALYLGTDLSDGPLRLLWIIIGICIAISVFFRLKRARSV